MPVEISGHIAYVNWEEKALGSTETYPRIAAATTVNTFSGGIEAAETACALTITYVAEKTGTFTGMEVLTGSLDGREGTFVVEQRGTFDADGSVHGTFEVVPGSATGALAGLLGTGSFTYRGESPYPYRLGYELG
ncbi:DUF3224 domain-containing protein [Streptomyces sp. MUM 203J]|uniref:DUF3224 domain-containing protein n=1 Tax=Streptomyces sp. MUM 203J TaxID=2791990 RepID=UPI001F036244|nr:DUF3224 domain-containing protein [Streptomyces sp. MUM 203J]MCH0540087.1 DUF3224 domain-containing protein [Streptomyces sp. MUM 203J]